MNSHKSGFRLSSSSQHNPQLEAYGSLSTLHTQNPLSVSLHLFLCVSLSSFSSSIPTSPSSISVPLPNLEKLCSLVLSAQN